MLHFYPVFIFGLSLSDSLRLRHRQGYLYPVYGFASIMQIIHLTLLDSNVVWSLIPARLWWAMRITRQSSRMHKYPN